MAFIVIGTSNLPVLAEEVTIQVVAKGSNPPVPIQSLVKITMDKEQTKEGRTDSEGKLKVELKKCDETGLFEATPISGIAFYKSKRIGCQPVPILIELPRNRFAEAPQVFTRDDFAYLAETDPALRSQVLAAMKTGNAAFIGQTMADVAWVLREQGDVVGAEAFQSISIAAGFEALVTVIGETPSDDVLSKYIIMTGDNELAAPSDEGVRLLKEYQADVGIKVDGIWGPQTYKSLSGQLSDIR